MSCPRYSRRQFINLLFAFITLFLGCSRKGKQDSTTSAVVVGDIHSLAQGISFDRVKRLAFHRKADQVEVLKMVCTHQACALNFADQKFICPCHGAQFSMDGQVIRGPATKDLIWHKTTVNEKGQLLTTFTG